MLNKTDWDNSFAEKYYEWSGREVTLQVDKEVCRNLWDNFYVPYIKGNYAHMGRFRINNIKLGKIISQVCSTSSETYFLENVSKENRSSYPIDYMILPVPNFERTKLMVVQQGTNISMTKAVETTEYVSVILLNGLQKNNKIFGFL